MRAHTLSWKYVFMQLPGVDPNDPSVKDLLASMQNESEVGLLTYSLCCRKRHFVLPHAQVLIVQLFGFSVFLFPSVPAEEERGQGAQ